MKVKAKKHLGQHFLKNEETAERIASLIDLNLSKTVVEIGPGMGVLTKFLVKNDIDFYVVEIDNESVVYLAENFPELDGRIIEGDFLKLNLPEIFKEQTTIIGNFPYNISSQILFKVLDNIELIPQVAGMFQKEVAERIASKPGSKVYGILSVLMQAYYDVEYLFTVGPEEFIPPPKVQSGVIIFKRKEIVKLECNEKLFKQIIKTGFNQRRKTLRNSLKGLLGDIKINDSVMSLRPEQLSWEQFVELTNMVEKILKNK